MIVGVVGGVGPEASSKFCEYLVRGNRVAKDQEHITFIHYCNSKIPDRTQAILREGESPVEEIVRVCKELERMGADIIVIPCNTAYFFIDEIRQNISIEILDIVDFCVQTILNSDKGIKNIGILATDGTIKSGIYENPLKKSGFNVFILNDDEQRLFVTEAIYGKNGVKAGKKRQPEILLRKGIEILGSRGAEAVILGCTEISLVIKNKDFTVGIIDPMRITANEVIRRVNSARRDIKMGEDVLVTEYDDVQIEEWTENTYNYFTS